MFHSNMFHSNMIVLILGLVLVIIVVSLLVCPPKRRSRRRICKDEDNSYENYGPDNVRARYLLINSYDPLIVLRATCRSENKNINATQIVPFNNNFTIIDFGSDILIFDIKLYVNAPSSLLLTLHKGADISKLKDAVIKGDVKSVDYQYGSTIQKDNFFEVATKTYYTLLSINCPCKKGECSCSGQLDMPAGPTPCLPCLPIPGSVRQTYSNAYGYPISTDNPIIIRDYPVNSFANGMTIFMVYVSTDNSMKFNTLFNRTRSDAVAAPIVNFNDTRIVGLNTDATLRSFKSNFDIRSIVNRKVLIATVITPTRVRESVISTDVKGGFYLVNTDISYDGGRPLGKNVLDDSRTDTLYIGGRVDNKASFVGSVYDLLIFNRELSGGEFSSYANALTKIYL